MLRHVSCGSVESPLVLCRSGQLPRLLNNCGLRCTSVSLVDDVIERTIGQRISMYAAPAQRGTRPPTTTQACVHQTRSATGDNPRNRRQGGTDLLSSRTCIYGRTGCASNVAHEQKERCSLEVELMTTCMCKQQRGAELRRLNTTSD